jgi:hypothetical protein
LRIHAMGGVGPLARRPGPVQDRRPLIAGAADAVPFRWPAVGGGRVLSADHAPQTPQAPSEDVSAATRPSTVLARPGTTARVAIRQRLLLRDRSSCAETVRDRSPPEYRATVVCLRVGEPTVRCWLLGRARRGLRRYVFTAERLLLPRTPRRCTNAPSAGCRSGDCSGSGLDPGVRVGRPGVGVTSPRCGRARARVGAGLRPMLRATELGRRCDGEQADGPRSARLRAQG